jgi:hypothetical protein
MLTLFHLIHALEALEELPNYIALAESHGRFEEADMWKAALEHETWVLMNCRSAGISEEFPHGEFAVIGVNYMLEEVYAA